MQGKFTIALLLLVSSSVAHAEYMEYATYCTDIDSYRTFMNASMDKDLDTITKLVSKHKCDNVQSRRDIENVLYPGQNYAVFTFKDNHTLGVTHPTFIRK